jgi:hypothetical protein
MKPQTSPAGKDILSQIRRIGPFVEASLTVTRKRCGRPQCRCRQEGPIHETALLTWKEKKVTHTLYVPVELREEVQKWVDNWKQLRRLIGQMSQVQRAFLLQRKKQTAKRS